MANQSSAYDFGLFEEKSAAEPERRPKENTNVIELPKERLQENRRHRAGLGKLILPIFAFLVISGLVGTYVNGEVQLYGLTSDLNSAQKTLSEQQDSYARLKIKSDCALSMDAVETYATQQLGMKKTSADQVTNVALTTGDKSQVVMKTADGSWGWLQHSWETVKGFLS